MMHFKWDMDMGSWVPVLLGKTKINDVELVAIVMNNDKLSQSHDY